MPLDTADIIGTTGSTFTITLDAGTTVDSATIGGVAQTISGLSITVSSLPSGDAQIAVGVTPDPAAAGANVLVSKSTSGIAVAPPQPGYISFGGALPFFGVINLFGVDTGIVGMAGSTFAITVDAGQVASATYADGTALPLVSGGKSIDVASLPWGSSKVTVKLAPGGPAANATISGVTIGKAVARPASVALTTAAPLAIVLFGGQ